MLMIIYEDTRVKHAEVIDAPDLVSRVLGLSQRYMLIPTTFDIVGIDLTGDVETVVFYQVEDWEKLTGRRVCEMGGAAAWGLYKELAYLVPAVNHHFANLRET